MDPLQGLVKRLRTKTEKIVALQEALQKDNNLLREQVKKLKSRVEELEEAKSKLEDRHNALQFAKAASGETNDQNLALKLKINELVREIDKCIAQLNK